MANAVKNGWKKVDGNKTKIGATLLFLSIILPEVVKLLDEFGADAQYSAYVGAAIMVVGVAHKIYKKFFGASAE